MKTVKCKLKNCICSYAIYLKQIFNPYIYLFEILFLIAKLLSALLLITLKSTNCCIALCPEFCFA